MNRQYNSNDGVHALTAQGWPRLRAVIALLTLLIFTAQSYLIQTHIHAQTFTGPGITVGHAIASPLGSKAPLDVDQCPLCQEAAHSGSYILPGAAAALPVTVSFTLVPLSALPAVLARAITHTWQGRAPPQN